MANQRPRRHVAYSRRWWTPRQLHRRGRARGHLQAAGSAGASPALEARTGRATCSNRTTRRLSPTPPGPGLSGACARDHRRRRPGRDGHQPAGRGASARHFARPAAPMSFGTLQLGPGAAGFPRRLSRGQRGAGPERSRGRPGGRGLRCGAAASARWPSPRWWPGAWARWRHGHLRRSPTYLQRAGTPHQPTQIARTTAACLYGHGPHQPIGITCAKAAPWRWRSPAACMPTTAKCWCRPPLAGHGLVHLPAFLLDDCLADGRLVPVLRRSNRPPSR